MFAAGGPGPFLSWGSCHRTFLNRKGKSWELKTDQLETQEVLSQPASDVVGGRGGTSCGTECSQRVRNVPVLQGQCQE